MWGDTKVNKKDSEKIKQMKSELKRNFCSGTDILISSWQKIDQRSLKKELIALRRALALSKDDVNQKFFEIGNFIYRVRFNRELLK